MTAPAARTGATALVLAKAPVPGQAKTRLAAAVGPDAAARLAAAALLDTLDACEKAFGAARCVLALSGDLARGVDCVEGERVADRVARWTVLPQRGGTFAARLARAHADAGLLVEGAPVVQLGMDTPQATAADLAAVAVALGDGADAVLGPAYDGGWWVLGLTRADHARPLADVPMSTPRTHDDTRDALAHAGARVGATAALQDVDDAADAAAVAIRSPGTRFARCWAEVGPRRNQGWDQRRAQRRTQR